ncbi:unnamed protein product [Merluccius merluccius]
MSSEDKNKLEAVLLLGDAFVEEIQKHNSESQTQKPEVTGQSKVTWWNRDCDGQRVTTSKRRKKGSSAGRYDLHVPVLTCKHCNKQWSPAVSDFVRSGYWPATMQAQTLFHQDLFHSFEAMKTVAPGMSRQAFTSMLDQRTKQFGRRSFLQYMYCNSEENQLLGKEPFVCPACSPEMVAVSVDGNRKLYRFQKINQSEELGFFDGVFLAQDSEVSNFVEEVRGAVKSTAGKAMCGESHWTAARETSKQANKLDEEGVEIAVCRHGFLLKGCATASPVDARGLQISIEALFVSICQKKHYLYRQNDRNKRRLKISQKIAQEKKRLLEEIQRYNQQPDGDPVDTNSVVQKLSNKAAESMIWPWQEQNTDSVDILTKKKLFDQVMLASRLTEEKQILVKEMMQHCQYLKDSVAKVQSLMATVSVSTQTGSYPNGFTEEGSMGLISLLKRRLQDLRLKQQTVTGTYRGILKPSPRLVEEEDGEMEEEMDWQCDNSSEDEDEDDAEVGT